MLGSSLNKRRHLCVYFLNCIGCLACAEKIRNDNYFFLSSVEIAIFAFFPIIISACVFNMFCKYSILRRNQRFFKYFSNY